MKRLGCDELSFLNSHHFLAAVHSPSEVLSSRGPPATLAIDRSLGSSESLFALDQPLQKTGARVVALGQKRERLELGLDGAPRIARTEEG